jgi:hypothetical protein
LLLLARNVRHYPFAFDRKRNKDGLTFIARDTFAAESNVVDR